MKYIFVVVAYAIIQFYYDNWGGRRFILKDYGLTSQPLEQD